jgi:hypothetical protein
LKHALGLDPRVADKLLLLGVDRDRRFAGSLEGRQLGVDVLELGVAVGVAGAFARFGIGLQAEAQPMQQAADQLLAGAEAPFGQRRRQMALALADPQQGSLGITPDRRLHQVPQRCQKSWLRLDRRLAPASRTTNPTTECRGAGPQVRQAAADGAARHPARPRDRGHPTATSGPRFARRQQTTPSLVQGSRQHIEANFDCRVDHARRVDFPDTGSHRFPDSFGAVLPPSRFFSSDSVDQAQALSDASASFGTNDPLPVAVRSMPSRLLASSRR